MDQLKIVDDIQEEILNRLPDEAIEKLAKLTENNAATEGAVNAILEEYGVDPNEIVRQMVRKEN